MNFWVPPCLPSTRVETTGAGKTGEVVTSRERNLRSPGMFVIAHIPPGGGKPNSMAHPVILR